MQLLDQNPETQTCSVMLNVTDVRLQVTLEEFDRLCKLNPDLRLELTKDGELIAMAPTGGDSGERNSDLNGQLWFWNRQGLGRLFDSSTGYDFRPLGGARQSPDASWILKSRLEGVDTKGFISIVPDFAIELRSESDVLRAVQTKMEEYRRLGVRLGWLIDPQDRQVYIYRPERDVEILESPDTLNGEDVLPGFVLDLRSIF